ALGGDGDGLAADGDVDLLTGLEREGDLLPHQPHPEAGTAHGEREHHFGPVLGKARVEGDPPLVVPHPAEAVHQGVPDAAGGGDVHAVGGVAVEVGEVHEEPGAEVV